MLELSVPAWGAFTTCNATRLCRVECRLQNNMGYSQGYEQQKFSHMNMCFEKVIFPAWPVYLS